MLSDVTFGQYYPAQSFVHKCDPRAKILFLIVYIVSVFVTSSFYGLAICSAVLLGAVLFSGVPVKSVLRSVRGILVLLLFTAVLNLFFYQGETVLVSWWVIRITLEGVLYMLFFMLRLFLLVMTSAILTLTTTPVSLTDGIESLLSPLKFVRFPVHELALIMSIALRFIPTLLDETERIMNAQKARGADFEHGGLISRVKAIVPILIPLLISAFRRAEELGNAMEARCYSGSHVRTKYKKLTFTHRDLLLAVIASAMLAGIIVLNVFIPRMI